MESTSSSNGSSPVPNSPPFKVIRSPSPGMVWYTLVLWVRLSDQKLPTRLQYAYNVFISWLVVGNLGGEVPGDSPTFTIPLVA